VPIAPGYRIAKESREIQFVAGSPPAVQVSSNYTIVNAGASNLNFIDVTLPVSSVYGRADFTSELDGHAATLSALPEELQGDAPNDLRLSFNSAWKQGQSHEVTIEYSFRSPQAGSRITLDDTDFHLGSRGAFAVLEPPKHILAPFPKRPTVMYYSVRVPRDFRVLARGTPVGRKQVGSADVGYRYRLTADDLTPFVVAGRYAESAPSGAGGVVFWTLQPVSIAAATAQAIGNAWNTLQKDFGPLDRNIHAPHVVEVPNLPEHISGQQGIAAVAFPGGALVSSAAIAQAAQGDAFVEAVSHALAHNWLGDEIYPAPDASLVLGEGLPEYAMLVIDEDRGGEAARRKRVMRYLADYDTDVQRGPEETLAVATLNDPESARRIALAKAPLFFAALEDECGEEKMRAAVKEVVTLLRGQEVGYPALRSALEQMSGKNLAPTFRLWLNEKGIPADFRARYGGNPSGGPADAQ
jgi:peptidase M1-like protein